MLCWVGVFLASMLFPASVTAVTLDQAYEKALHLHPSILNKASDVEVAERKKSQFVGGLLPRLSLRSTQTFSDQPAFRGAGGRNTQNVTRLTLEQSLFQGGREYFGWKLAGLQIHTARLNRSQAKLDLYKEVAEAFLDVLIQQKEMSNLQEQIDLLERRIGFLKKRARIGQSKFSDVLSAQSQLARNRASLSIVQASLADARVSLSGVSGLPLDIPVEEGMSSVSMPMEGVANHSGRSEATQFEKLPGIQALELSLEAADYSVNLVQTDYLPQINLQGNYYLLRTGAFTDSKWDISLNATWEFFSGGQTYQEARVKALEHVQLERILNEEKRTLSNELRQLQTKTHLQNQAIQELKNAATLSQKNYQEFQKEFRSGLVSNLDVLRSFDDYLTIKRTLDKEQIEVLRSQVRLKILSGVLPTEEGQ